MDTIKSCGAEAENLLALDTTLVRAGRLRAQARLPCSAPKELFFANRFIFGSQGDQVLYLLWYTCGAIDGAFTSED